jgi:hypothetical protein
VVLFSHDSNPALHAPRGQRVVVLQRPDLKQLEVDTVLGAVDASLRLPAGAPINA